MKKSSITLLLIGAIIFLIFAIDAYLNNHGYPTFSQCTTSLLRGSYLAAFGIGVFIGGLVYHFVFQDYPNNK